MKNDTKWSYLVVSFGPNLNIYFFIAAMEFHENLHDMAVKEGLKGRKLHKSVESFTWNITILKVIGSITWFLLFARLIFF